MSSKIVLLLVAIGLVGIGVVIGVVFFKNSLYQESANSPKSKPSGQSTTQIKQASKIVDVNSQTAKYINSEYGFEIVFPKFSETYMGSCEDYKETKNSQVPVKVFEDGNSIYFSNEVTVEVQHAENENGSYNFDWGTCKVVPTTLSLIKNGYSSGLPEEVDGGKNFPLSMKYTFGKVNTDEELIKMGEKMYGARDCEIASKKYVNGTKDSYQISLRGQGAVGEAGGSCWINAATQFLYSPTTKTAVVGSGYQNCIFGSEKLCVPELKLLD